MRKFCIVVGLGRGGIGNSLAKKFSAEGYNVAMIARSNLEHLEKEIPNSKSYQCDTSKTDQIAETVSQIRASMGSGSFSDSGSGGNIDALLYNVGSAAFKPFAETSIEEFELAWRTGPAGIFAFTKACLPAMTPGSCIGLTGATASWRGMPYTLSFASSKMATRGLAQALARDLGPSKGIHVFHVVVDGMVKLRNSDLSSRAENEWLDPDDIAETYWQLSQQPPNCWTQETSVAAQGSFGSILTI